MKGWLISILGCVLISHCWAQTTYVRTYGSKSYDHGRAVKQLEDGGFIICGATASRGSGNTDAYLLKVDSLGALKWTNTYGTEAIEWAKDILILNDGFLLIGYSNYSTDNGYDGYVIKTDKQGKVLWEKFIGGANWDFLNKGITTSDGGYVLVGETSSFGNGDADVYAIKLDPQGNIIWEKSFGEVNKDWASGILETVNNEYLILGTFTKDSGDKEITIIQINSKGEEINKHVFEDSLSNESASFISLVDGGYAIVGTTEVEAKKRILTMAINNDFKVLWKKIDPKDGENNDVGRGVAQSLNGEELLILAKMESYGAGKGDFGFYIRDSRGVWQSSGTVGEEKLDDAYAVSACKGGGFVLVGTTESYASKYASVILIKVDDKGKYDVNNNEHYEDVTSVKTNDFTEKISVSPNPFRDKAVIQLSGYRGQFPLHFAIYTVDGRLIRQFNSGFLSTTISSNDLGKGMFLLKITSPSNKLIHSGRIITH